MIRVGIGGGFGGFDGPPDADGDNICDQNDICFGDNAPYSGHLKNDCLYRHGTQKGLPHALIELRQDEIADAAGQARWAAHMVDIMKQAENIDQMNEIRHFGSVNDAAETG